MAKLSLIIILILSAVLRFWDIQNTPRGLYIDEISIAWNTYLISTTGYDEHQKFLPLAFQAFGEYKLPGYIYATVPIFWLFGPGIWQLRFISAIAGVLGSWGIYLLVKELVKFNYQGSIINNQIITNKQSPKRKHKLIIGSWILFDNWSLDLDDSVALIAALLFAITPWSVHLSRAAFEANLALTTSLFAIYFLLKLRYRSTNIKQLTNIANLILCILTFSFSFYTYNSARMMLPIIIFLILLIWRKDYSYKTILPLGICSLLLTAPAISGFLVGGENARAQQVLEFGHKQLELGPVLGTLYKYFDHFSGEFLFFNGDPSGRHSVRELGELPMPLILFLPIGLYVIGKSILDRFQNHQSSTFLLLTLLLSPIPSMIATPSPHILRAIYMLPALLIISAVGIVAVRNLIIDHWILFAAGPRQWNYWLLRFGYSFIIVIAFSYSLLTYQHVYYIHWSPIMWPEWNEHWTKAAQYIANTYPEKQNVVMENGPLVQYYLQFFDAVENNQIQRNLIGIDHIYKVYEQINDGDVVGIAGWKQTPPQLTQVHEIVAINQNKDVIYKIGIWKSEQ